MIDWGEAGSIGAAGVLTVFAVLIILAIMVHIIGRILHRRSEPAERKQ